MRKYELKGGELRRNMGESFKIEKKIREEEEERSSLLRPNFIIRYLGNIKLRLKVCWPLPSSTGLLQEDLNFGRRLSYKLL